MIGMLEAEKTKKTAEDRTITSAVKIQIVVDHLVNHDISERLFVDVEVVGHENHHVTLLYGLFLFSPSILKLPQLTIGMHETELGCSQLVIKIQAVALPEHVGHRVIISNHKAILLIGILPQINQGFEGEIWLLYFFSDNASFVELNLHGGIHIGELANGQVVDLVVGQTEMFA